MCSPIARTVELHRRFGRADLHPSQNPGCPVGPRERGWAERDQIPLMPGHGLGFAHRLSDTESDRAIPSRQMHYYYALIVGLLILLGCHHKANAELEFTETLSMPDCARLDDETNERLREEVIKFFLNEVGAPAKKLRVDRGAACQERLFFALFIIDADPYAPFLVDADLNGKNMTLHRPE
jgi:hypothetical protein